MIGETPRPQVGDRYEDKDWRNEGRIVEVRQVSGDLALVQVEVHPKNPSAVGIHRWVGNRTLAKRYRKVSR